MEIYLIQRLTYIHYVLLAITVIVGLVTVIYTVDYIGSWVCEEPEFGREKKFVRRSLSLFICLLLLFIFVPTTEEYLASKKSMGTVIKTDTVEKSKRPSESGKIINLDRIDYIPQYQRFSSEWKATELKAAKEK